MCATCPCVVRNVSPHSGRSRPRCAKIVPISPTRSQKFWNHNVLRAGCRRTLTLRSRHPIRRSRKPRLLRWTNRSKLRALCHSWHNSCRKATPSKHFRHKLADMSPFKNTPPSTKTKSPQPPLSIGGPAHPGAAVRRPMHCRTYAMSGPHNPETCSQSIRCGSRTLVGSSQH